MKNIFFTIFLCSITLLFSCTEKPQNYKETGKLPAIFPDYCNVTIPVNIAPLNFKLTDECEKIFVSIMGKKGTIELGGKNKIDISISNWQKLLLDNSGDSLTVTVFAKQTGVWNKYLPFKFFVQKTPVNPYLVYRLIAPGYEAWSEMGIYQRNLTNFEEKTIMDNNLLTGACMNCHSFCQNSADTMMFHLRGNISGTMLIQNQNVEKLNTKNDSVLSNCVYPYWHPSGKFIAYSVNKISQVFHATNKKRIEVVDSKSDVVVYDIANNKLLTCNLLSSKNDFETFPAFSPDGKRLYFCLTKNRAIPDQYDSVQYNLCSISFDAATGRFGNHIDTLVNAEKMAKSISFPRVSPDGKFLMFTMASYGNFSIWHKDADLYLLNLSTGKYHAVKELNSDNTESYHSWSSESRWVVFSSRRTDGLYTRPYLAYIDENGNATKPFILPQRDPDFYRQFLKSYNIPEFIKEAVKTNPYNLERVANDTISKSIFYQRQI